MPEVGWRWSIPSIVAIVAILAILAIVACGAAACDARLPDPDSPGARLYRDRCSGCHRLYAPSLMKPEMWRITVNRMQGEMARRGADPLSESETTSILSYLEQHSGGE